MFEVECSFIGTVMGVDKIQKEDGNETIILLVKCPGKDRHWQFCHVYIDDDLMNEMPIIMANLHPLMMFHGYTFIETVKSEYGTQTRLSFEAVRFCPYE